MQTEICDLKESLERSVASNKIEVLQTFLLFYFKQMDGLPDSNICASFLQVEVLQEEITYATEEVDRLTKVLGEQDGLLQASQEQVAQKESIIKSLKQKVLSIVLYPNVKNKMSSK